MLSCNRNLDYIGLIYSLNFRLRSISPKTKIATFKKFYLKTPMTCWEYLIYLMIEFCIISNTSNYYVFSIANTRAALENSRSPSPK